MEDDKPGSFSFGLFAGVFLTAACSVLGSAISGDAGFGASNDDLRQAFQKQFIAAGQQATGRAFTVNINGEPYVGYVSQAGIDDKQATVDQVTVLNPRSSKTLKTTFTYSAPSNGPGG